MRGTGALNSYTDMLRLCMNFNGGCMTKTQIVIRMMLQNRRNIRKRLAPLR